MTYGLIAFPLCWNRQIKILRFQMDRIREKTLSETTFITSKVDRITICQQSQIIRIMIRREIHKDTLSNTLSNLNRRNHIAVSRNHYSNITVLLICIRNDLRHNTGICFLLFV